MHNERRWLAVSAIGLSLFLSTLDKTIVALALPPIVRHFQLSDSLVSAVTLGYAIPLTVLILPVSDLMGRFMRRQSPMLIGFSLSQKTVGFETHPSKHIARTPFRTHHRVLKD